MVKVRIPATTANIGPGFDTFGMAFQFYNYVRIQEGTGIGLTVSGETNGYLTSPEHNLAVLSAKKLFKKLGKNFNHLSFLLENNIPITRGLGSSAAAIVGGMLAANAYLQNPLTKEEIFQMAVSLEGHPDNIAPALFGGFNVSLQDRNRYYQKKTIPAAGLKAVAAIPSFPLSTKKTRRSLPRQVSFADAVYNINRASALVLALATGDWPMFSLVLDDKLHQPYRFSLIPGAKEVVNAAKQAGALGAVLSGSGPTILAFTVSGNQDRIGQAMQKAFRDHSIESKYQLLLPDVHGAMLI